jgi:anti-sigma factor RsiW
MKPETELKILAYVDDELPSAERAEISKLLASDPAARALADELTSSARWLRENEPVTPVPAPRQFYWSQIARRIEREEKAEVSRPQIAWWIRWLAPAGAFAAAVAALFLMVRQPEDPVFTADVRDDVESSLEQSSSFTFRSETEGMTVVWVDTHRN